MKQKKVSVKFKLEPRVFYPIFVYLPLLTVSYFVLNFTYTVLPSNPYNFQVTQIYPSIDAHGLTTDLSQISLSLHGEFWAGVALCLPIE